jgi:predicted nucleic acid-binding protein
VTVVVDASVALKWVLQEEHTEHALALRDLWQESGEFVIAPPIFRSEVTNALHQRVRRGEFGRAEAQDMLDSLIPAVATVETGGLYNRALTLAGELMLASTYGSLYLALAEAEGCEVWTADPRLVQAVQQRFPQVHAVMEAAAPRPR